MRADDLPSPLVDSVDSFDQWMRAIRTQRGLSLRALARLALTSKSCLQRFEAGVAVPTPETAKRIDDALQAGGRLAAMVTSRPAEHPAVSPLGVDGRATGQVPFLPKIVGQLSNAILPVQDSEPVVHSQAELTAAVYRAWRLRQAARYEDLAQLLSSLIGAVEQGMAVSTDTDDEKEKSIRLAVHTYNAASSLLKKLGDSQLALISADRALRYAGLLGDPLLGASAAYRLANVLLPAYRLDDAQRVALRAASTIEPGKSQTQRSLAMWGGLLLTAAVATARKGDEPMAWEILGEARTAARLIDTDYADIYAIFGPTNVAIHGVQVAVELGDGKTATRRALNVNADALPRSLLERRAQLLIDIAHGYVLQNKGGEAFDTLLRAEKVAAQEIYLSGDVHKMVRAMLAGRYGASKDLRNFADRISRVADSQVSQ